MKKYFKCEVQYMKPEPGSDEMKLVTEVYLVEAQTYTEAETRMNKEMERRVITKTLDAAGDLNTDEMQSQKIQGATFTIKKIEKMKLNDIINPDGDASFWLVKSTYVASVEKGKEKVNTETALVNAVDASSVIEAVKSHFKVVAGMLSIRIVGLAESPIIEVIQY